MGKRADDMAATRQRIVEAAVRLHGTIGPAATTVAALAQESGVTRLTVYRHFADDAALLGACSAHWATTQVLPEPERWQRVPDAHQRVAVGLSDLYRFYRAAEPMLTNVRRDRAALPAALRARTDATERHYRDTLLQPFGTARGRPSVRAALGHAVSFWTWRSLCRDQGLSNRAAVQLMTAMVVTAASDPPAAP